MKNNEAGVQKDKKEFHFELESRKKAVCEFQAVIYKLLPNSISSDIFAMALHEIIMNAAEHGNQLNPEKEIDIDLKITGEYIAAVVKDQGTGFNWRQKISQNFDIGRDSERGRGIMMTDRGCDSFYYNQKGNKAYLLKKINL
ncbi:ATP-binding protein [Halanaerobium sp. ST460_2HS_T2]|uniref:ATP-binding protein n=1 Tax=Halanaerobium sp. ST460_2HS_T2 TaxID=2183914 RepID=UPI000DF24564|nr:ATP-binding protein [Halanaerobium sp. ST460_2HS_T2]RCW60296.1 anti-sigma regulatory factor (Ser/Thr protein kinase) [Halanaerobium sp. ST460_2HS_T2]